MEIDNIKQVERFFEFKEGDIYLMYVHRRPKDFGSDVIHVFPPNTEDIISIFPIESVDDLEKWYPYAKKDAVDNNARVYLSTQCANKDFTVEYLHSKYPDFDLKTFSKDDMRLAEVFSMGKAELRWKLTDVDGEYRDIPIEIEERIRLILQERGKRPKTEVFETKNGYHILSERFPADALRFFYHNIYTTPIGGVMLYYFSEQD